MFRKSLCCLVLGCVALVSLPASADKYDLELKRLWKYDPASKAWSLRGEDHFQGLMGDLGAALAPRFLGPAATLGSLGFQIAFEYNLTNIRENSEYWQTVMTDHTKSASSQEGADSFLQTATLHVRKGLPFSTEVGGTFTKLMQSNLWGVGIELKATPLEGFTFLPELSFGGNISTFLGSRDYAMLTAGGSVLLSKKIGIAGLFKLAPYAGYNFVYVHGSSNVIPVGVEPGGQSVIQQVFGSVNIYHHFALFGIQTVATVVNFGFEAGVSQDLQTYALKMGMEF
jgi:hypothetical protein